MISAPFRWLIVIGCLAQACALAQSTPTSPAVPIPEFRFVAPLPAIVQAAQKAGMPLDKIAPEGAGTGLHEGDRATVLVQCDDGKAQRQWMVQLVKKAPSAQEQAFVWPPFRFYTSTGHEIVFTGTNADVAIHAIGPFREGKKPDKEAKDRWDGAYLNDEHLSLGLDHTCRVLLKLKEHRTGQQGTFSAGNRPFDEADFAANQQACAAVGIGPDDERAFVGAIPALNSFFQIANQTPGLKSILFQVLDVPWWSLIRRGGQMPDVALSFPRPPMEIDPLPWGLPAGTPCYALALGIALDNQPALTCQLAVTAPRPPLLISAGIVGIAVQRPDGKGPALMIRVLAAHCAPEQAATTPPIAQP